MREYLAIYHAAIDLDGSLLTLRSMNSRAIVPIGIMFSLSLICGNLAYLYLSVSFIQMLKVSSRSLTRIIPSSINQQLIV